MSDLISRKQISNYIKAQINPYGKPFEGTTYEFGLKIMEYIDNMESAYDVEQVVKELEELISMFEENNSQIRYERYCKANRKCKAMDCFTCVLSHAIEIVKGGGVNE